LKSCNQPLPAPQPRIFSIVDSPKDQAERKRNSDLTKLYDHVVKAVVSIRAMSVLCAMNYEPDARKTSLAPVHLDFLADLHKCLESFSKHTQTSFWRNVLAVERGYVEYGDADKLRRLGLTSNTLGKLAVNMGAAFHRAGLNPSQYMVRHKRRHAGEKIRQTAFQTAHEIRDSVRKADKNQKAVERRAALKAEADAA
jgi:hypothetical protein